MKGEGEIEKLQTKVVEMRRKLDDTTAAMQELGRENQSLQVSLTCSQSARCSKDTQPVTAGHTVKHCAKCYNDNIHIPHIPLYG